jgi:hypothetical protein
VIDEVLGVMRTDVLPFLDTYSSPEDVCRSYTQRDPRVLSDLEHVFRVVAALLVLGKKPDAMEVMERHFGKLGPRRRYAKVFDNIAHL